MGAMYKRSSCGWFLCDICGRPYNFTNARLFIHKLNPDTVLDEDITNHLDICPICEEKLNGWIEAEKEQANNEKIVRNFLANDGDKEDEMVTIDMLKTGNRINELRVLRNLTVRDIQNAMGFNTPQAIYKWVHGVTLPAVDNLVILAEILEVSIDDILVIDKGGKS